jgi:hypothetical protein
MVSNSFRIELKRAIKKIIGQDPTDVPHRQIQSTMIIKMRRNINAVIPLQE